MEPCRIATSRLAYLDTRQLIERAKLRGILPELTTALELMLSQLQHRASQWGDPLRNTALPGGVVYRGLANLLRVEYVVYKEANLVLVSRVWAMPNTPLE